MSAHGESTILAGAIGDLTVEELTDGAALRPLAPALEDLCRRAGRAGPFYGAEWLAVQAAALAGPGHSPARRLRLFVVRRRGALAAVLPLVAAWRLIAGIPARVLGALADDHAQRFDLLTDGAEPVRALFSALAADRSWDVLELRDLPEGAHGAALCELAAAAGFPTGRAPGQRSPYLPLPSTFASLEATLDAKFRANVRRRGRRLAAELGPLSLERITGHSDGGSGRRSDGSGGPEIDAALADGFLLEASGWKAERGTAIALDPRLVERYRALARVFADRGELSLHFLRAGERRVAFHFAVEVGGVYYLFKPGYDDTLARFGLGHLLCMEVARELIARGAHEIDFLGDDLPWKRSWTTLQRAHEFRFVFRPNAVGRALCAWKFRGLPALRRVGAVALERLGRAPGAGTPKEEKGEEKEEVT